MKIVRYVVALVLLGVVVFLVIRQGKKQQSSKEDFPLSDSSQCVITDDVLAFFPQATSLTPIVDVWTEVYDTENNKLGYLVYSAPYSDKIIGFAGKTPLLIALDKKQKIIGTKILHNKESESYVHRITNEGLFDSWDGLSVKEAIDKQVDAISGATYTSEAVTNSLKVRLAVLNKSDYYQSNRGWAIVKRISSLLVIACAVFCFFQPRKAKPYRLYFLGLSIIVLGFWQGTFLSLTKIHASITNDTPFVSQYVFWVLFVLAALLPFFTRKQFYCMWLCPFGGLQELIGKLFKKKLTIPLSVTKVLFLMRKILLLGIIFLLLIGVISDLTYWEPFSAFNIQSASAFVLIFAGLFLVLSAFITKPWCRFFCPTGQLLDVFKDISIKKNNRLAD